MCSPVNFVQYPQGNRNYCVFNSERVNYFLKQKEFALPYLSDVLSKSSSEPQILESLYIIDKLLDNGVKGIEKMYPVFSRFNCSNSPYVQTFLAGIYRKILIPDAFGPLCAMLLRNSFASKPLANFDPNEEIGGAILEYVTKFNRLA